MSETTKTEMEALNDMSKQVAIESMKPKEEAIPEKPYTFRKLTAVDIFPMVKIISKIGVNEFTACFEKDGIKALIASFSGKDSGDNASIVGISVLLEVVNVIMGNLPKCEHDIYNMLSQTSNLSVDEVKGMDMCTFAEMIIDFIKKEEFKDFLKVVSKFIK